MRTPPFDREEVERCLALLRAVAADRGLLATIDGELRRELLMTCGQLAKPEMKDRRRLAKALRREDRRDRRELDRATLDATGIRALRRAPVYPTPPPLPEPSTKLLAGEVLAPVDREGVAFEPGASPAPGDGTSGEGRRDTIPEDSSSRPRLGEPRTCYVCKSPYRDVHFFYDAMCRACGDLNHAKRSQTASLVGRVALITGARVKIGYHAAIKLLRAGARVIVTTRFPRDAARRYAAEPDFDGFRERLQIYGLDLRHTPSVEHFTQHLLGSLDRLDFIVNNACQTVRRPPAYYAHMLALESGEGALEPRALQLTGGSFGSASPAPGATLATSVALSQVPLLPEDLAAGSGIFPAGQLDRDLQQVDLRELNSWRLRLGEISTTELLEVQLVNAVAPFVLNGKLKPLMAREKTFDKHIVNVSAMEGQFYRAFKTDRHPHTNMAKAALNMMTRTSAPDYARDGIYLNSVDTGWITDEDPVAIAARKATEQGETFSPPLDVVDGAARILDPIFDGLLTGNHRYGLFFKDYAPAPW